LKIDEMIKLHLICTVWFKCFDYEEIQSDIDKGLLKAYLAEENETLGIDRYIAISKNGLGYEWRQLNEIFVK